MANPDYVKALFGGVDASLRRALNNAWDYLLKNVRFGRPGDQEPCENFQANFVEGTTHATPGTEFSILHGRDTAPYLAWPVLDLQTVGSAFVDLTVSRAADTKRVYFTSTVASAPVTLYVEG